MGRAGFEPATFCTSSSFKALNGEISVDWGAFRKWAKSRYAKSYAPTVYGYAEKFGGLLFGNLAELYSFSRSRRGAILRALSALSKYLGVHEQFKQRMKDYGMKWEKFVIYDNVELKIAPTDILYITGDSGSGKSVLLKALEKDIRQDMGLTSILMHGL